jgi:hypothetical protein
VTINVNGAAAVVKSASNATDKRVRDLPITLDRLYVSRRTPDRPERDRLPDHDRRSRADGIDSSAAIM